MTRTAPLLQPSQSNHGHKRKGKPVEAWMLELEKAQDEENGSRSLDLTSIEQIADGVEQMVFSWGLHKQERGQEYVKLSKSLAKENSHVLLPWSLNKTDELGLDSASESDLAVRNGTLDTTGNTAPRATQPQVAQARTPGIGTKRTSPKRTQPKQRGSRLLDNFGSGRDRSVSPGSASENPQLLKAGNLPQPKYESSKCLNDSCHGVLTSSNRMRNCTAQNRRETLHDYENRAREDPTCQAMTPEQECRSGSIELEIGKDNCMNSDMCIPSTKSLNISKQGHNLFIANEADRSPVWTPDAATSTPERRNQQSMMNQTGDQYPQSNSSHDAAGNASPLLSQSPLCAQSPSPRLETAQRSEVISNEHDGVFTSPIDLPMGLPIYENGPESLTPLLPCLDSSPSCGEDTESVEVGGHNIKVTALRGGNDVLEDKFQALVNINACSLGVQEEHQLKPSPTSDVEELQIALLECAMEYEIKTIEAKMKMQELKLRGQQSMVVAKSEQPCPHKVIEPVITCKRTVDNQRLQQFKKQMTKLQHEKDSLSNELHALREKERKFERQKRSLEDALLRVNRLQREVMKKEHEVVEWQLKEKETKAQLQEVGEKLKRERHAQLSLPLEPKKLLTLLPALREWLRSLKKVGLAKAAERRQFQDKEEGDSIYPYNVIDGYNLQPSVLHSRDEGMPVVPAHLNLLGQFSEELSHHSNPTLSVNQVDVVICCLTKEIHALQKELNKLARS